MANKPLKSIKFPTLNDTYTVDVQKDGEYPLLTAGEATHVYGSKQTDKVPYLIRSSHKGYKVEDKVVGGTICWNQLVVDGGFEHTTGWTASGGTLAVSDGIGTLSFSSTPSNSARIQQTLTMVQGHKYLCRGRVKASKAVQLSWRFALDSNMSFNPNMYPTADTWTDEVAILSSTFSGDSYMYLYINRNKVLTSSDTVQLEKINVIDLTLMFGSTIADYI